MAQHITNQSRLTSIRRQDRDFRGRVSQESHVLVQRHCIFCLTQVLNEVRRWLALTGTLIVRNIDELVVELETSICLLEFLHGLDSCKIAQLMVAPSEQLSDARPRTALLVQCDHWDAQSRQSQEKTLLKVSILTESNILDNGGVLEVIST